MSKNKLRILILVIILSLIAVSVIYAKGSEVGSVSLADFLEENKEKLACDVILISDTHIYSNEQPTVTTGLRGLSYMEVEVEGPNRDLHSGLYGGAGPNPINVLAEMIAKLHDEDGKITIYGFYEIYNIYFRFASSAGLCFCR